jgi:hypothetical protein
MIHGVESDCRIQIGLVTRGNGTIGNRNINEATDETAQLDDQAMGNCEEEFA